MRSKGLGWLWGLAERRKLDAGGPAGGPCSVLYGKNQRRGRRWVRRRRIFIQPPEMVERQLGVAFLMRSGSSCVGTAQPTFYYPKSACSSLPCSWVAEEHKRWGPVVRPAARAVFCMGRIRDEEEEGLGDVGSSSNRLKWSRDSWELHS